MPRLRQSTVQEDDISFFACIGEHGCSRGELFSYKSLAELNEQWEDYKPAEPLIKDEKIRKAVRAWAEADGADEKIYLTIDENGSRFANKYGGYIEFGFMIDMEERLYTIAELCGEEEG
jgi:hypothetical protein